MKIGLVLVSYIYSQQRAVWANQSFQSLSRTKIDPKNTAFDFVYRPAPEAVSAEGNWIGVLPFAIRLVCEPDHVKGLDPVVIWSFDKMLGDNQDVTHVVLITDDLLYNPDWLNQLIDLINRHPDAKAWSVYRSAYTRHHKTIEEVDGDVKVTSISGVGCISRKEWLEYAPDWKRGHGGFPVPDELGGGNTMDLHHCYTRPGDCWVTGRSYIQHIGTEGLHTHGNYETAIDFVGEE